MNFGEIHGPRTGQVISPKTIAIEMVDSGHTYRFQDIEEIEVFSRSNLEKKKEKEK